MMAFFSGIISSGLVSWHWTERAGKLYVWACVIPLVLRLLLEGSWIHTTLAVMFLLFGGITTRAVRHVHGLLVDSLRYGAQAASRERRLWESEQRYRSLFELSSDPMWVLQRGRFVVGNEAAAKMLGLSGSEALRGLTPDGLSPPFQPCGTPSRLLAEERTRQATDAGFHRFEWVHRSVDGRDFWVEVSLTAIRSDNAPALFCVWRDIEDQKAAAAALVDARERAEEASREKSSFLATMSHEIRTPMNAVIGMSEVLVYSDLPERDRERVQVIHGAGRTLLSLLDDILDFSKIEAGHLVLASEPLRLDSLMDELSRVYGHLAQEKGLDWKTEVDCDTPGGLPEVSGDEGRLRQILVNLVTNAIKFTPAGEVCLRLAGTVHHDVLHTTFTVRDTGVGMSEDVLTRVFEPFRQADGSTTRQFGGTGLGLSIVRRLVEAMDGSIDLTSELGAGSCFVVSLRWPVVAYLDDAAGNEPGTDRLAGAGTPHRVLVAEDDPVNRAVIGAMLEHLQVEYQVVEDGLQAVQAVAVSDYSLVLMDCQMPKLDGPGATRQIRSAWNGVRPRPVVVALTANVSVEDRENCEAAGMDGFLPKPVTLSQLSRLLLQHPAPESGGRGGSEPGAGGG